jgi:hypothetical protein
VNYSLLTNCFCGVDSATIEQYLIDGYDDITKGLINYQIFDSSCNNVFQTVLKFNESAGLDASEINLTCSNPFSNELVLHAEKDFEVSEITIIDALGKMYHLFANQSDVFEVGNLPKGMYILLSVNQNSIQRTLIKI